MAAARQQHKALLRKPRSSQAITSVAPLSMLCSLYSECVIAAGVYAPLSWLQCTYALFSVRSTVKTKRCVHNVSDDGKKNNAETKTLNDDGFNESNATTQLLASKYVETFYTNISQDSYTTHEIIIKKLLTSCVYFLNSVKSIPLDASIIVSSK